MKKNVIKVKALYVGERLHKELKLEAISKGISLQKYVESILEKRVL